ncbi:MAG: sulfite exporter TauE/SafE family protein [Oscillatoriales cyanobacterium]|nr:MAG: sulfite exporter TauE/SafE family protein [Oscillatoriales cyanobacterium]
MFRFILGHVLAVGIGLSLGLIGGGGSILAVPILIYVIGLTPKAAIAMSLAVVGLVSAIGAIPHGLNGNVNLRVAAVFTPPAMVGAYLGARLASLPIISDRLQLLCFGVIMVLASLLTIRKGQRTAPPAEPVASVEQRQDFDANLDQNPVQKPNHTRPSNRWLSLLAVSLQGLGVGVLTGFVGVGGGFLIIPALVLLGGLPMKEAIGTSLVIITLNSVSGFLGYLGQVDLDLTLLVSFTLAASCGTIAGAWLNRRMDARHLQTGFGYFVLVVAGFVLFKG